MFEEFARVNVEASLVLQPYVALLSRIAAFASIAAALIICARVSWFWARKRSFASNGGGLVAGVEQLHLRAGRKAMAELAEQMKLLEIDLAEKSKGIEVNVEKYRMLEKQILETVRAE